MPTRRGTSAIKLAISFWRHTQFVGTSLPTSPQVGESPRSLKRHFSSHGRASPSAQHAFHKHHLRASRLCFIQMLRNTLPGFFPGPNQVNLRLARSGSALLITAEPPKFSLELSTSHSLYEDFTRIQISIAISKTKMLRNRCNTSWSYVLPAWEVTQHSISKPTSSPALSKCNDHLWRNTNPRFLLPQAALQGLWKAVRDEVRGFWQKLNWIYSGEFSREDT